MEVTLEDSDHTIGYLLQQELLKDPLVTYAGYTVPSYFERKVLLKFTINDNSQTMANEVLIKCLDNIKSSLHKLKIK